MKTIKVKFNKSHPAFAYFKGDVANIAAAKVAKYKLLETGFVMTLPDDEEDDSLNTLPQDLPARGKLFAAGYDDMEKIKAAGDMLLDVINKNELKKVLAYEVKE